MLKLKLALKLCIEKLKSKNLACMHPWSILFRKVMLYRIGFGSWHGSPTELAGVPGTRVLEFLQQKSQKFRVLYGSFIEPTEVPAGYINVVPVPAPRYFFQIVGYRVYTPVFTVFSGCLPNTEAGYGYGDVVPVPRVLRNERAGLTFGYGYEGHTGISEVPGSKFPKVSISLVTGSSRARFASQTRSDFFVPFPNFIIYLVRNLNHFILFFFVHVRIYLVPGMYLIFFMLLLCRLNFFAGDGPDGRGPGLHRRPERGAAESPQDGGGGVCGAPPAGGDQRLLQLQLRAGEIVVFFFFVFFFF